jgi:hypothetical protein
MTLNKCNKGKILNPNTGRCILKNGILAKKLFDLSVKNKKILHNKYGIVVPNNYIVSKILGKGVSGTVYILCEKIGKNCTRAIKIQEYDDMFKNEVKMHKEFEKLGLSPKFYEAQIHKSIGKKVKTHIISERFDGTLSELLKVKQSKEVLDKIFNFIKKSHYKARKNNIVHGDMHWDNLAYKFNKSKNIEKLYLNDFGWSSKVRKVDKKLILLDLLQLYRTSWLIKNKDNRKYLNDKLYDFILEETGFDVLNYNEKELDQFYLEVLHKNYEKKYF